MSGNGGRKSLTASYSEAAIWWPKGETNCIGIGATELWGTHPLASAEQATKSATDQEMGGIDGGQYKASI